MEFPHENFLRKPLLAIGCKAPRIHLDLYQDTVLLKR